MYVSIYIYIYIYIYKHMCIIKWFAFRCAFVNMHRLFSWIWKLVFPHSVFESYILLHLGEKPQVPSRENSLCYSMHVNVKLSLNSRTKTDIPVIRIKMKNVRISVPALEYFSLLFISWLMMKIRLCFVSFMKTLKKFSKSALRIFW